MRSFGSESNAPGAPLKVMCENFGAQGTPGVVVRRASEPKFSHITFNGAPGALLSDPKLRIAISKAIDRQAIVNASQHGIVTDPEPLDNHIDMMGQKGYRDNSAPVAFDPQAAAAELDALGWKLNGDVREKDGRPLVLRDVMYQQDAWVDTAKIVQEGLAKAGNRRLVLPRATGPRPRPA